MNQLDTQVAIIGGGPSGLLLSQLLNRSGIETIVLERASRQHVLSRIRAGVLESGTVEMLRQAGVSERMDREGIPHHGCYMTDDDLMVRIDLKALTGSSVLVYGQTEVTTDLYAAQDSMGTTIHHNVSDVQPGDLEQARPYVTIQLMVNVTGLTVTTLPVVTGIMASAARRYPRQNGVSLSASTRSVGWVFCLKRNRRTMK